MSGGSTLAAPLPKLHGGRVLDSKTVGDNTAQLTRSPHFSSSRTGVPKGVAVMPRVLHDMPSLLLTSNLAPKLGVLPPENCQFSTDNCCYAWGSWGFPGDVWI